MTPEQRFSAKARKQAAQGYEIDSDKSLKALANELKPKRRGLLAWVVDLIKGGRNG